MIDGKHRCEYVCVVAILANIACLDMRRILPSRFDPVMTVDAVANYVHVIEVRGQPAGGGMAVVAGIATRNVVGGLSGSSKAIVAGAACAGHLCMVDRVDRREIIGVMAVLADVRGCYVRGVLASGISAVMAAAATADDIGVVEVGWYPPGRRVAVIAIIAGIEVGRVLAGCRHAVMTGAAGADNLSMVDRKYGSENVGVVTVLAHIGGLNMSRIFTGGFHAVVATRTVTADIHVVEVGRQPANG